MPSKFVTCYSAINDRKKFPFSCYALQKTMAALWNWNSKGKVVFENMKGLFMKLKKMRGIWGWQHEQRGG